MRFFFILFGLFFSCGFRYCVVFGSARTVCTYPDLDFTYHNYTQLTDFLHSIECVLGDRVRVYSIGKSVQLRELWAIEFRPDPLPVWSDAVPSFRYTGNIHGNEIVGREMTLHFIQIVADAIYYNTKDPARVDPRISWLLQNTLISVLPSLNPDGFELRQRRNANGFDLNRNFPNRFPIADPTEIQPETYAYMNWSLPASKFQASANLHTGALVVNYPYDNSFPVYVGNGTVYVASPDDAFYRSYASAYARAHPTMWNSSRFPGGITNGAKWWEIDGGLQDWSYVHAEDFDVTLELTDEYLAPVEEVAGFWAENRNPMIALLEQVHRGIRGRVVVSGDVSVLDMRTAAISVDGIDKVIHCTQHGYFYRLLADGVYTLRIQMPEFEQVVLPNIIVRGEFLSGQTASNLGEIMLTPRPRTDSTDDGNGLSNQATIAISVLAAAAVVIGAAVFIVYQRKRKHRLPFQTFSDERGSS
eukprot:ANDGO_08063.mRNA.1 Carboxypeptidase SOL1